VNIQDHSESRDPADPDDSNVTDDPDDPGDPGDPDDPLTDDDAFSSNGAISTGDTYADDDPLATRAVDEDRARVAARVVPPG
jgi:hypothetical protein